MAIRQNLRIQQGVTFQHVHPHRDVDGSPVDLSAYTATMAIKSQFGSINEAYLSSVSGNIDGQITLGSDSLITIDMTAAQTLSLLEDISGLLLLNIAEIRATRFTEFLYELNMSNGITVERPLHGKIIVERSVAV